MTIKGIIATNYSDADSDGMDVRATYDTWGEIVYVLELMLIVDEDLLDEVDTEHVHAFLTEIKSAVTRQEMPYG
jgi:hypothetical protein